MIIIIKNNDNNVNKISWRKFGGREVPRKSQQKLVSIPHTSFVRFFGKVQIEKLNPTKAEEQTTQQAPPAPLVVVLIYCI